MRRLVWTSEARRDFREAIQYIVREHPPAARAVQSRVEAALAGLARRPIGHVGRVDGTYEKTVLRTPYIIAYALSDREVTILRVLHGSRDWPEGAWPDDDPPADRG